MARAKRGARVSATAFVLGLLLAGPHVSGVAAADNHPDEGSSSISTGPSKSDAPRAKTTRSAAGVGATARPEASAGGSGRSAILPGSSQPLPLPGAAIAVQVPRQMPSAAATNPVTDTTDDSAAPTVSAPEPIVGPTVRAATAALTNTLNRPTAAPVQAVTVASSTIERVIDTVDNVLLSGFPSAPISDLLAGALWLTRRTVFPTASNVASEGSAACVACTVVDIRTMDLAAVTPTWMNLTGTPLDWANLFDAGVYGASLTSAVLGWADLHGVPLTSVNLDWVNLNLPSVTGVPLIGEDLTSAFLVLVYVALAYLVLANLTGVTFTGLDVKRMKLAFADLTGADRADAHVKWPTLYLRNPSSTDFGGTDLYGPDVDSQSQNVNPRADVLPVL